MKVYMSPNPQTAPTNNGIGRIVKAIFDHMPSFGIDMVTDPGMADVHAYHAGAATEARVDVLHCHGLYWADLPHAPFQSFHGSANRNIAAASRRARYITVPSDWVAEPYKRDMLISPLVVGHGIDFSEWTAQNDHGGYILWNKTRMGDVCDPSPAGFLAEKGHKVVSTFSPKNMIIPNMTVIGSMPFDRMKGYIQNAQLYLATTPETFGIGTLEAMACGVPILGFDWCGTADLVEHKVTGWLVAPGDFNGLLEGAAWLKANRKSISEAARAAAATYDWPAIVEQYARIYEAAAEPEPEGVSVVITNYNYSRWVGTTVASCLNQTFPPDEIIVVDDGSTDNSVKLLQNLAENGKIRLISQENQGVAAARNRGIEEAQYPYIITLDGDDQIAPEFIASTYPVIKSDRGIGVAYTGLRFIREDGTDSNVVTHRDFRWEVQSRRGVPPPTCVPSCSIFRKEMWERIGGYRQEYAPGEDAEFWTRGLSRGFTARLVTPEPFFLYRGHDGSQSRSHQYVAIDDDKPWIEDGIYPFAAPAERTPLVFSYAMPAVSVIIPVGPGHEENVEKAIRSVVGQKFRFWELLVVDDTGLPKKEFIAGLKRAYPFLRTYKTRGKLGPGFARNVGINKARGKFVLFLDADDWLRPDAIMKMLNAVADTGKYAFSDFYIVEEGKAERKHVYEYDREMYLQKQVMHSVTALVPTEWARDVSGFDQNLPGWEEYDFYMKLAIKGYCGTCVREPLFYYQLSSGSRRLVSQRMSAELNEGFRKKFGGIQMAKCCGGNSSILDAKRALRMVPAAQPAEVTMESIPEGANEVRLEFTGQWLGPVGYKVNGRTYYGARDDIHRFINVPREDVPGLVATGKWRIVPMAPPPTVIPDKSVQDVAPTITAPSLPTLAAEAEMIGNQPDAQSLQSVILGTKKKGSKK